MSGDTLTIITGASRGIGHAVAQQLLAKPQALVLQISRTVSPALQETAERHQTQLTQWACDLSDSAPVAERLAQWMAAHPPGNWHELRLINNAMALPAQCASLEASDPHDMLRTLQVGLAAPMLLTAAFLRAGRAHAAAGATLKVLNVSSGLAQIAMQAMAPYCAVKAGLDHLTRCLIQEEQGRAGSGAKVAALHPGIVNTDMQAQMRETPVAQFPMAQAFKNLHAQSQLQTPQATAQRIVDVLDSRLFGAQAIVEFPIGVA